MQNPKISICIPTYNRANFVGEAIKSVLEQTFKDFELIILDDGSTDNTQEVIKKFVDSRIKSYKNEKNTGMVPAWNKAVSLAKGEYISILHSDDRYLPEFLENQSKLLDENKEAGYIFSACRIIDEKGNLLWIHTWKEEKNYGLIKIAKDKKTLVIDGHKLLKEHIFNNFVRFPTVMIRREVYEKLGLYTNRFRMAMDWYMWMKIELAGYKVIYSDKALAEYRKHAGTDTAFLLNLGENAIDDYKVVVAMLEEARGKNIFSKKEENAALHNAIRNVLENVYKRVWDRLKHGKLKEAKNEYLRLQSWQKEFNIKPSLFDKIYSLFGIKL